MTISLSILHADERVETGDLTSRGPEGSPAKCRIEFESQERKVLVRENDDFFECLIDLRRIVDEEGGKVLCQGARRDVFPSPMQRRTSGGLTAYAQRLGEKAFERDTVKIFDKANADLIGTVEEQRAYHEEWLISLGWQKTRAGSWFMVDPSKTPSAGEIEEAKRFPNGTVSRIGGGYLADEAVPSEAIEGCWEVDENGQIIGSFLKNPRYNPDVVRAPIKG